MRMSQSLVLVVGALLFGFACGGSTESTGSNAGGSAGKGGSSGKSGAGGSGQPDGSAGAGASSGTGGTGTGGGGTGGSGTGGIATGGTGASAGAAGAAASAGASGAAGSGGATGECTDSSQCRLFSDCCTCVALAPGEPDPPSCPITCIQSKCAQLQIDATDVSCAAGVCAAGFACAAEVLCRMAPPVCQMGFVPSVVGTCWGPCVPAEECASVRDCAACTDPLDICVTYVTQLGPQHHCVPVPKGCEGTPNCRCLGSRVCLRPFGSCTDNSGVRGVSCDCPVC